MNINPIILSIPIYFLLIGIELVIQLATHRQIYRLNDAITNISCGITQQITGVFLKIFSLVAYQLVYENLAIMQIPVTWWSIILLFLGVDFCYYWAHRKSHEINLFWGGHVVHHQSEDFNFSVALRQGTFQVVWTFWFYLPLAFLGFDTTTFLLINALNTVYQFWIHTELIGKLPKPIEWIFNTPSHHRVHHGRDPKYIDKNHAGSLIIWDRMFGTFQEEEEQPTYGITKPIDTWNPVWANFQHYAGIMNQMKHTKGGLNKIKVLFNKPGWRPADQGGMVEIPQVNRNEYMKYDLHPDFNLSSYILFQFVIVLGLTSLFLFKQADFDLTEKIVASLMIIWSITQLGLFMEKKTKWKFAEYLRTLTIAAILILNFEYWIASAIVSVVAIISIVWFYITSNTENAYS